MNLRTPILQLAVTALALAGLAVAIGLAVSHPAPRVLAQAPIVTYTSPKEGDVLQEAPVVLQMCFAQPVNTRDMPPPGPTPTGLHGDFQFSLVQPGPLGLGMRIVFQPDGNGLAIYAGKAAAQANGEWTFTWRVTNPETLEPAEGTIKFTVDPGGQPIPKETPPVCLAGGSPGPTYTPTPVQTASPTPGPVQTPSTSPAVVSPSPSGAPTPSATATPAPAGASDEDSGPDILLLSLLTIGVAGGAALLALIGYLVRKRFGYSPHQPGDGAGGPEHH